MQIYPLKSLSIAEAIKLQYKLVDSIQREFKGRELLNGGDYGLDPEFKKPRFTAKVENVLADFFAAERALLVRGAGTGAIRSFFNANLEVGAEVLIHQAPIYPTTEVTFKSMDLKITKFDFNSLNKIADQKLLPDKDFTAVLVQHSRQKIDDSYDFAKVIEIIKTKYPDTPVITDDNYAAMKVDQIGVEAGADLSTFSLFKLQGPPGIGLLVGSKKYLDKVESINYSGGSQVQGTEALAALRSLVNTPVSLAVQAQTVEELNQRLQQGEVAAVKNAFIANAQSKVVILEFDKPIAKKFLEAVNEQGGVPYPVGSESRYEIGAMFYRISGTFRKQNPEAEKFMVRINPMRAGADTIIRIINQTISSLKR
ncbi:aminotransferase class V-fold PLP-dependent enzyme [Halanaerobium sp. ST460_2HS_T2]|jgi:cystathionine beta-lyase/cystathionine gamma-synthase|uniref:aminotransferase class V-fold PLP-dependent enzyme n=1 Tax=Halanaerobium sp. ST460_2HS_T2 TaxID=2183914 RepID=UPI000DF3FE78|nr:aminotransferase class V-fold PLP-dependent enzyme [Halanaerobium sp. ST460_2HS_T2]RCW61043.1 aminotransferase class V [Halanaerobium sp. ST460_2HS_T2]